MDFICVHCNKNVSRGDGTLFFQFSHSIPHCEEHKCPDWKTCKKNWSRKGKRFLKGRKKEVRESMLKKDGPQTKFNYDKWI